MAADFSRSLLRVSLAQLCQSLGWQAVQSSPMEILTDVLEKYIVEMGKYAHRYSEQFGRTEPNLDDLGLAFSEMGVNLHELIDYVKHVDPIPFALDVPRYPVRKPHHLNFPKPNSRELAEREEHVDDHFPAMHPGWDEEVVSHSDGDVNDEVIEERSGEFSAGDKRPLPAPGSSDEGSPSKKLRILPDEAAPSNYEMKGVTMSHTGYIVGEGKLPDAKAPPPPTPTTPMPSRPPLFKTPSTASLLSEPGIPPNETPLKTHFEPSKTSSPGPSSNDVSEIVAIKQDVKPEVTTPSRPMMGSTDFKPKSPRGRVKSPKGERFKLKSFIKASKSPGRKSPIHSPKPARSPGRPKSKSPVQSPGRPKSPGRSPIMSPPKSPVLSPGSPPPKSPAVGRGRSPGRPPKSPKSPGPGRPKGRSPGRPPKSPKSPGPGRPPKNKSPGRPPKSPLKLGRGPGRPRKDSVIHQSPIQEYLMTGEPPIGEKPPTKAQLKSPPPMSFTQNPYLPPTSMQKLEFGSPKPSGVITETVSEVTTTIDNKGSLHEELSPPHPPPPKVEKPAKPPHKLQSQKSEKVKGRGRGRPSKASLLALELANKEPVKTETLEKPVDTASESDADDKSGRVTPDWIKKRQDEIQQEILQKEKDERENAKIETKSVPEPASYINLDEPPRLSPIVPFPSENIPSPKIKEEVKIKKKEKKKDKSSIKILESESDRESKSDKRSKKEKKLMKKKMREKLLNLNASPASSPDVKISSETPSSSITEEAKKAFEFPSLSDTPKPQREPTIQPIRIEFGAGKEKTKFTIKMTEDSDKSDKEHKKKKKKKEKEKDKEKDEKKEKSKDKEKNKDKEKRKKEKKEKKEDKKEVSVPKLTFKFGGGNVFVSETPRDSPKYDSDAKSSTKADRPETPQMIPSREQSPSPTRRSPSPLPPKLNSPLRFSPPRFTPSPDSPSVPKTPSIGYSRSPSPASHIDYNNQAYDRSPSPAKTPCPSPPPTPPPPQMSPSPSPPPPSKPTELPEDVGPPPPPSSAGAKAGGSGKKGGGAVIAETQGTIINEKGEMIWICPACKMPDDGSPMIGCDLCDDWYHWPCVDITEEPPEDESWYCPKHRSGLPKTPPKKSASTPPAKRGRGRGRGRKKKM